ncbi:MAG: nucleoside 2-deoxyribosyltransferase [Janthinobacterium lividum]
MCRPPTTGAWFVSGGVRAGQWAVRGIQLTASSCRGRRVEPAEARSVAFLAERGCALSQNDEMRHRSEPPFRFYLAGPSVFALDPAAEGSKLKAFCSAHGAVGLYPLDNEIDVAAGQGDLSGAIREANMELIRQCDAVIADMVPFRGPSMDPGTAYEMGVGAALGKLVVGYTSDPRPYVERVSASTSVTRSAGTLRDSDGMQVEDFGLADNLMMAKGADAILPTAAEAIAYAVARLLEA